MADEAQGWKRESSRTVTDCGVLSVREDVCRREGETRTGKFYVVEVPDWTNVIALTPKNEMVVIEQFRHGSESVILEIPGGVIDEDEEPLAAAQRELREETGYTSEKWKRLGVTRPNPALQTNFIHHYLAEECVRSDETEQDENESIATRLMPVDEVLAKALSGDIDHSLALAALFFFKRERNK
jgi:8-oxo-dGTP pyrophosphatase MutT (NUDIX family)